MGRFKEVRIVISSSKTFWARSSFSHDCIDLEWLLGDWHNLCWTPYQTKQRRGAGTARDRRILERLQWCHSHMLRGRWKIVLGDKS